VTEPRPFSELRDTGLLWLINTTVFHPRGYALAVHYADGTDSEMIGWSLVGDGTEVWAFGTDADIDSCFRAVKEVMP
jgi:hypothetical protein